MKPHRSFFTALLLASWLLVAAGPPASAHAGFVSSVPENGAVLETSPGTIAVTFTERPDVDLSSLGLVDAGGRDIVLGPPALDGDTTMTAVITEALPDGAYTVNWRVVSTEDGHVTAGAFSFGIGQAAPAGEAATVQPEGPTWLSVAAKASLYAGLMLLFSVAVVGLGAFGGRPSSLRIVAVAAGPLAFLGAMGIWETERRAAEVSTSELLSSSTGRPFAWLVVATLVACAAAAIGAARQRWRPVLWVAGGAAAVAMFVRTTTGHPAATANPLVQETVQWVHFMAAAVWVGGLVLLLLLHREASETPVAETRRYSRIAGVAVAIVVVTGLGRSLGQLGGLGGLLDAREIAYGRALSLKVLLAAVVIALGAVNRYRSLPRLSETARPLRRIVGAEIVGAAGVVMLTATLTGLSPVATEPQAAASGSSIPVGTVSGSDFATTIRAELTVTPGGPGPNAFRVRIADHDSGEVVDADAVSLRLDSATRPEIATSELDLGRDGDVWVGQGAQLASSGTWSITVSIDREGDLTEVPLVLITDGEGTPPPPGSTFGTTTYPSGVSLSLHLDCSIVENVLHVDLIAPDGSPMATGEVTVVATPEGGTPVRFTPITSEGRGTVAVPVSLEPGPWTVDVVLLTPDARSFQGNLFDAPVTGPGATG